jgi:hypothetical protein
LANAKSTHDADRQAAGAGSPHDETEDADVSRPGVTGGDATFLPESGRGQGREADASRAEGTVGAHGEMDFTGAPAGTSAGGGPSGGSAAAASLGGGPGGGAMATGGTGPGVSGPGPQSAESTLAALREDDDKT